MHLLHCDNDGRFVLTEFVGKDIPRYAILSHTWGADVDEVTFVDLQNSTGATKQGYRKIQFCRDQAAKHNIRYYWVDTCCIDKTSSTELTEAINSMFAWYRDAAQCYVYLSDVSVGGRVSGPPTQQEWYPAFQQSRWFTRGWTLQELVAPSRVEFFSVEGQLLGDKPSLVQELYDITGISRRVLQGQSLAEISVDERMSWVRDRKTKREEDMAYSMLGIFGVHMPLIYGEGRKKAFARLQREIKSTSGDDRSTILQKNQAAKPFSTVPFAPDPDFVDRPEIITWLRDKCAGRGARAALVGLGGVGKSQLAIQYAHSIIDASPQTFVFWVHASTQARFEEEYKLIADRLQLPERSDPKSNVLRLVSDWLRDEANGRWFMIVDNADNVETFSPSGKGKADASAQVPLATYLPQSRNGAILVTSRSKDAAARLVGGYNNIKEVVVMDESEGLQLFRNKLQQPPCEESVLKLLKELNCIPLAIIQAVAYINRRSRMTVAGYLAEFQKNNKKRETLLKRDVDELRRDDSASNSVVTTWQMSFEQITQERESAAHLLSLMSFFNPHGIPESTLRRYSKEAAEAADLNADQDADQDADNEFEEDLDTLQAYSLVSVTADNETCEMHALVQFCTRVWLSSTSAAEQWERRFVTLMAQEFPYEAPYEEWAKCQQLLPHVEPLFDATPADEQTLKAWTEVLSKAACYLLHQGNYDTAQRIAAKALAARQNVFGLHDLRTLHIAENLAVVLAHQGRYKEAEKLVRQVLENRRNQLGGRDCKTLDSMNHLAEVLVGRGEYKEAEKFHRQVLEGYRDVLGERHPSTLVSMNNLGNVLSNQGKYEEAETLQRQVLEGRTDQLGGRHPDTLKSIDNLAGTLSDQGKYEVAETLYRQALEARTDQLGGRHPDTLTGMNNLALVLSNQGKYEEAEKLNREALEARRDQLGGRHPDTLTGINNLALVLSNQGKYEEAEKLNREALKGREEELGECHPYTLTSVYCLAYLLHKLRRYDEASELYQKACDGLTKQLGAEHPETISCRKWFAKMQEEIEQARPATGKIGTWIIAKSVPIVEVCREDAHRSTTA
jgi:tetratricopeptide (TPR) repeat protein